LANWESTVAAVWLGMNMNIVEQSNFLPFTHPRFSLILSDRSLLMRRDPKERYRSTTNQALMSIIHRKIKKALIDCCFILFLFLFFFFFMKKAATGTIAKLPSCIQPMKDGIKVVIQAKPGGICFEQ
jgi:hypothetical protein